MAKLAYQWHGQKDAQSIALVLHGIMGSKKNWSIFLSKLSLKIPNWAFLALDLRNHGESPKSLSPFDLNSVAEDLVETCMALNIKPKSIIGHSYGGKVAILSALKMPSIKSAIMLDCPPGKVIVRPLTPNEPKNALEVMEILQKLPQNIPTIEFLLDFLRKEGVSENIALWMSTNLIRVDNGYRLIFNPSDCRLMLEEFLKTDIWPRIKELSKHTQVHMVAADKGGRIDAKDESKLKELAGHNGFFHVLKNSGHFMHSDNPEGLMDIICKILEK